MAIWDRLLLLWNAPQQPFVSRTNGFRFTQAILAAYKLAMNNRRKPHPRYTVDQPVTLLIGNNACRVFCNLKDMSLLGAGLKSVPLRYLPATFKVLIPSENVALPCKLRWIDGREAGVQFIGEPDYHHNIYDEYQASSAAWSSSNLGVAQGR